MVQTDMYEGMLAETITIHGAGGDVINAYFARPLGAGPFPGIVLLHHMPGWDEWYREVTRKFAHHGYAALCPNLYAREGHGAPEDVAAKVRGAGGVPDDQVVGDAAGAMRYLRSLPYSNGKVGLFGEEDRSPPPEQVAQHERELVKHRKTYEFHMYPGAGHGFFYYDRPSYRQQQAVDGWSKVLAFLERNLGVPASSR